MPYTHSIRWPVYSMGEKGERGAGELFESALGQRQKIKDKNHEVKQMGLDL